MTAAPCLAAIVLLMDTSGSVSERMYLAQRDGTAAAFEDQRLIRAVEDGRGLAVLVAEFAFVAVTRIGWTLVRNAEEGRDLAAMLRATRRTEQSGSTAIGHALRHAHDALRAPPCDPGFRVIDIATDGQETARRIPAAEARDAAAGDGITINAIAFTAPEHLGTDPSPELLAEAERWLRDNVATGFVRVADGTGDFAEAFRSKIVLEVTALAVSWH